jgi:type II secretory pathway pseudopilin PulG
MARRPASAGFTYLGVLLLVALMGVSLTVVSQLWQTKQKRDKEDELLFIGDQFRRAIGYYYASTPGGVARYPTRLEDLLRDPRFPGVRRYLRRVYRDPMTGTAEWGLEKAGDSIVGVHSLSEDEPLKKAGFGLADRSFEGTSRYSEWVFVSKFGRGQIAAPGKGGKGAAGVPTVPGGAPSGANR